MSKPAEWPALDYPSWADTKKTLQLYTQIAGKVRLALSPLRPEWLFTPLIVTSRGLTTGPMPWGTASVEMSFDFVDHRILITMSEGKAFAIALVPQRCVADVFADVMSAFGDLGIELDVWDKPQEIPDTTPLAEDREHCTYDPISVGTWFAAITAVRGVFDEWSADFFGKTSIQFWWGAFDLAVLRFNGRHAEPREGVGYIMRYDLDAEFMNAGFWIGDDDAPDPAFYAYLYPQPPGCDSAPMPDHAVWVDGMGEWIASYEKIRAAADPAAALKDFLDCVYHYAGDAGGWDLESFAYTKPAPPKRKP